MQLNVEPMQADPDPVGLGTSERHRYVDLNHTLREYDRIRDHGKRCQGGQMKLDKELNVGLHTTFTFLCSTCGKADKMTTHPTPAARVNMLLAWAAMAIGIGYAQTKEFLAVLNVRAPGARYFRQREEAVAKVSPPPLSPHATALKPKPALVITSPLFALPGLGGEHGEEAEGERGGREGARPSDRPG